MVACRKCAECISDKKRRWIGRVLAAQETATETWFCTFTYGGGYDNEQAYWLEYRHLQNTFKKIRKAGYRFQYLSVGEYGTEADRAHFHAMIFWQGDPPPRKLGVQLNHPSNTDPELTCPFWEHGIVQYELPRHAKASAVYMMDYLDKEDTDYEQRLRYSKQPALGTQYLEQYAATRAKAGLALFPDGPSFTIPNNNNRDGKPFWYRLDRDSAVYRDMCYSWLETWAIERRGQPFVLSQEMREWLSDVVQNPENLPPRVRKYLAEVYDIQANYLGKQTRAVATVCEDVYYDTGNGELTVEKDGTKIWQNHLGVGVALPGVTKLQEPQVARCLAQVAQQAPSHVRRHVASARGAEPWARLLAAPALQPQLPLFAATAATLSHPMRPAQPHHQAGLTPSPLSKSPYQDRQTSPRAVACPSLGTHPSKNGFAPLSRTAEKRPTPVGPAQKGKAEVKPPPSHTHRNPGVSSARYRA